MYEISTVGHHQSEKAEYFHDRVRKEYKAAQPVPLQLLTRAVLWVMNKQLNLVDKTHISTSPDCECTTPNDVQSKRT